MPKRKRAALGDDAQQDARVVKQCRLPAQPDLPSAQASGRTPEIKTKQSQAQLPCSTPSELSRRGISRRKSRLEPLRRSARLQQNHKEHPSEPPGLLALSFSHDRTRCRRGKLPHRYENGNGLRSARKETTEPTVNDPPRRSARVQRPQAIPEKGEQTANRVGKFATSRHNSGLGNLKRSGVLSPRFLYEEQTGQPLRDTQTQHKAEALRTWASSSHWPERYFEGGGEPAGHLELDSSVGTQMEQLAPTVGYVEINGIRYPRPTPKGPSLRRNQSDSSLSGSSDQKKRESKSAAYRDARYDVLLAAKGSHMCEFDEHDITENSKGLCRTLLVEGQTVPLDSLFRDDLFKRACREIEGRNEAMIIQDIARLIVPSAKHLAIYGAKHLDHLIESVDEGWTGCIPVQGPRPQPDYSLGFGRSAFMAEQLRKLDPLIGSVYDTSYFVATYRMYFPFLTCEVKCGAAGLDVADRQNAHSMTIAVRSVVELFRAVKREHELNREILAFSMSHDHRVVRIYGHYPIIDGDVTQYYRHPIHTFDFTALEGKEKWTAYTFTKNIYDIWMPLHLEKIYSAIRDLPEGLDFEAPQSSELPVDGSSDFQILGGQAEAASVSASSEKSSEESQLSFVGSAGVTPTSSFTKDNVKTSGRSFKRPKKHSQ